MYRLVARVLSAMGVIGCLYFLSLSITAWRATVNGSQTLVELTNELGLLMSIASFVPWLLALYDWGTRFTGDAASKRRWGRLLIFTAFFGAWYYWLRGPRPAVASAHSR